MDTNKKISLYILSGFLGTGKTTFLEKMITGFGDKKIAVIMNEFGKMDVDGQLISHLPIMLQKINNGSIFCSCKSDKFIEVMIEVTKEKPDILIVESSGLANPSTMPKILQLVSKLTDESFDLKGNIGVMDATNVYKLAQTAVMVPSQIAHSDIILLNKIDLASPDEIKRSREVILEHNPNVEIIETTYCNITFPLLLQKLEERTGSEGELPPYRHLLGTQNLLVKIETPISKALLTDWIKDFVEDIYRLKGFAKLEEGWHFIEVASGKISIRPADNSNNSSLVILASGSLPIRKIIETSWNNKVKIPIIIE